MKHLATILTAMALGVGATPASWAHVINGTDVGEVDQLVEQANLDNAGKDEIAFIQDSLFSAFGITDVEILPQVQNQAYAASDTPNVYGFLLDPIGDYFMIKNAQWTALFANVANMSWAVFDSTLLDPGFNIGTEEFTLSHIRVINPTTSVPEPATLSLLGVGLLAVGFARRRAR